MASPSVTWTFTNGTTSDATQVNTNFTDIINGLTDGTKDLHIAALNTEGACSFDGAVTLGDTSADDLTVNGSIASHVLFKTGATYNLGASTSGPLSIYLGNSNKTTRLMAGTIGTSWTLTLPNDVPTVTGVGLIFNTSGTAEFRYQDKFTASKTGDYTATGDETVIPCAPSASMTISLPAASTMTGKRLIILKTDSDASKTVTINPDGAELINGAATYVLYTQNESVEIICNGSAWFVVNHFAQSGFTDFPSLASGTLITASTTSPAYGNSGSPTTHYAKWRRDGMWAEIIWQYRHTNATGATAGSGTYFFNLPSFLPIDTTLAPGNTGVADTGAYSDSSWVGVFHGNYTSQFHGCVIVYDGSRLKFYVGSESASANWSSASFDFTTDANMNMSMRARVPITGWNP